MALSLLLALLLNGPLSGPYCDSPHLEAVLEDGHLSYTIQCPQQAVSFAAPIVVDQKRPETLPLPLPSRAIEGAQSKAVAGSLAETANQDVRVVDGIRPWHPIPSPTERYRNWSYAISIPAGYVGFIGTHIVERKTEPFTYRGQFRDRYIPVFLATDLRVYRFENTLVIQHPAVDEQPFSLGLTLEENLGQLINTLSTSPGFTESLRSDSIFVLGASGESIAFDFPSGVFIHERLFEGKDGIVDWYKSRLSAVKRSVLRYQLSRQRRPMLKTGRDRQDLEWNAQAILQRDQQEPESLSEAKLAEVALIPEIDQFLTDPQVAFSGSLGRFQAGSRRGSLDTPWGWDRSYVDGDWLYLLMQGISADTALQASGCPTGESPLSYLCKRWRQRPLPTLDLALHTTTGTGGQSSLRLEVIPEVEPSTLPSQLTIELANGASVMVEPGDSVTVKESDLPARISKTSSLFEQPTVTNPFPHYNNQTDNPWRWMLNSIFGLVGAAGGNFTVAAQFAGRPLYSSSPRLYPSLVVGSSYVGGGFASSWNFGQYNQALQRAHNIGFGIEGSMTRDEIDTWLPAFSTWTGYRWSSRISQWDFLSGSGFSARLTGGISNRDNLEPFMAFGTGILSVKRVASTTALAARLRYNRVTGPEKDTLGFALGSRDRGVRGISLGLYPVPERWLGTIELRSVLGRGYQNLFGLFGLTQLRGTLFTDVAYIPDRGASSTCRPWVGSAGIGLQWLGDMVGIAPGALTLDLGFPIRGCDSRIFEVYVGFVPPLLAF